MCWRSRRGLLLITLLVACAAGAETLAGRWRSQAKTPTPETRPLTLHIDSKHLDFGDVWETDQFEWTIPIRNTDTRQAELIGLAGSCNCGSVEPAAMSIPPGETRTLRIKIDLRPKAGAKVEPTGRPFATTISGVFKNGTDLPAPVSWNLRGRVKRVVRTVPTVEFGLLSELGVPFRPLVIPVEPVVDIASITVSVSVPEFQAALRPRTGAESGWALVVTPGPGLKRGAYKGTVTLMPVGHGGTPLTSLQLPLSAEVVPDVEAAPGAIFAGGREVGAEVTETLTLRSLSNRPFVVDRAEAEGNGVSVVVSDDGRSCTVRVRVMAPGPGSGRVRLVVRPDKSASVELVIPVQVHGFPPG